MSVRIGASLDQNNDPIGTAVSLGVEACQIMLGDGRSWKKPTVPGGAEALREAAQAADVDLYVHSNFVINVASTNNRIRIPSRKLVQQTLDAAAELGARGVIVHGGHVTADDSPEAGFDNWRKCIDGLTLSAPLLIENTAGGANAMCRSLDRLARVWEAILTADGGDQVGFCLDTCHAHAGGLELAGLVDKVRAITGRIDLVHANDSRDAFNSGADRHANLGQGQCDPDGMLEVFRTAGATVLLETPTDGYADDVAWLRERL